MGENEKAPDENLLGFYHLFQNEKLRLQETFARSFETQTSSSLAEQITKLLPSFISFLKQLLLLPEGT